MEEHIVVCTPCNWGVGDSGEFLTEQRLTFYAKTNLWGYCGDLTFM